MAGETKKESKPKKSVVEIVKSLNDISAKFTPGWEGLVNLHEILQDLKNLTEEDIEKSHQRTALLAAIVGAIKAAVSVNRHHPHEFDVRYSVAALSEDLRANKGISRAEEMADFVGKFADAVKVNIDRPRPLVNNFGIETIFPLFTVSSIVGIILLVTIPFFVPLTVWSLPGLVLFGITTAFLGVWVAGGTWLSTEIAIRIINPIRDYLADRRVNNAFEEVLAFKGPTVDTTQTLVGELGQKKAEEKEASTSFLTKDVEAEQGVSAESGLGVVFDEIRKKEESPDKGTLSSGSPDSTADTSTSKTDKTEP